MYQGGGGLPARQQTNQHQFLDTNSRLHQAVDSSLQTADIKPSWIALCMNNFWDIEYYVHIQYESMSWLLFFTLYFTTMEHKKGAWNMVLS